MHLLINVKPKGEGGGDPVICGAFDFSEDVLVKIPTVELQNLLNQIKYPKPSND